MYSSSYSSCNSDKGVRFLALFCIVLISGSYFACFVWGLVRGICHGSMWIQWIVLCVWVRVVTVLECGLGLRLYIGYLVLVWFGIGNLFVGMYILWAIIGLFVLGSCCWGCLHLLVCRIGCVCWLVMSRWWGVPCYCGKLFLGLLDKGVHTLTVYGATCLCHFCGIVCSWGFEVWEAKRCFFYGYPCIGHI